MLPWAENVTSSEEESVSASATPVTSTPSYPKAVSAFDRLYSERIEKDKARRLATFDMIQSLHNECTFRRRSSALEASPVTRSNKGIRSLQAREMLLRGDWCFDCARKYAAGTSFSLENKLQSYSDKKHDQSSESANAVKQSETRETSNLTNGFSTDGQIDLPNADSSGLISGAPSDCETNVEVHQAITTPDSPNTQVYGMHKPLAHEVSQKDQLFNTGPRFPFQIETTKSVISVSDVDLTSSSTLSTSDGPRDTIFRDKRCDLVLSPKNFNDAFATPRRVSVKISTPIGVPKSDNLQEHEGNQRPLYSPINRSKVAKPYEPAPNNSTDQGRVAASNIMSLVDNEDEDDEFDTIVETVLIGENNERVCMVPDCDKSPPKTRTARTPMLTRTESDESLVAHAGCFETLSDPKMIWDMLFSPLRHRQ